VEHLHVVSVFAGCHNSSAFLGFFRASGL